jgi:hypothetical protein
MGFLNIKIFNADSYNFLQLDFFDDDMSPVCLDNAHS